VRRSVTLAARFHPEALIAVFGFLLHFTWEMLQMGYFRGMSDLDWQAATSTCARATFGDIGLMLVAYWVVALGETRGRGWLARPSLVDVACFTGLGLLITLVLEVLATRVWGRWHYMPAMPLLPGTSIGLLPLAQWVLLPPLVIWLTRGGLRKLGAAKDQTPKQ
jgi:hypothetical protein